MYAQTQALEVELADIKWVLQEGANKMANDASVPVATDPALPVNHSKDLPTLTTKFQALREEFLKLWKPL